LQHKQLQPQGAPNAGPPTSSVVVVNGQTKLNECFDKIRQEFDILAQDANVIHNQKDEADAGRMFILFLIAYI
jgi:general transcriptional corepressor TUP1